jgi:CRISP-associated protein Cas1
MSREIPWLAVYGFGAHIKSTQKKLTILYKNSCEEYPVEEIHHLLVVGGHTLSSTTVSHLVKNGSYISFFEPDGTPVGIIRPYGSEGESQEIQHLQEELPRQRYATMIARATLRSRLLSIEKFQRSCEADLLYEGELQILQNALNELEYLVKLDEIRRLSNLTADMYYEIFSRVIPERFNFRRRSSRPLGDPINAMLSFGYAMLYGNCLVSVIGARMNPDIGLLHDGPGALVQDLTGPFQAEMIDPLVRKIAQESLNAGDFEQTPTRCMLSDALIKKLITVFKVSIDNQKIDCQVNNFLRAINKIDDFTVMY